MSAEAEAKALFLEAGRRLRAGDYAAAERNLRAVLALAPNRSFVLANLAVAVLRQDRAKEALGLARRALALDKADAGALFVAGSAEFALGRLAAALAAFDQLVERTPRDAEAWAWRGHALVRLSRPDEALASYERALRLQPDHVAVLFSQGNLLRQLNRPAQALANYQRAVALAPDFVDGLYNCGNTLRDLNRLEEALASYERVLGARPNDLAALLNRANVLRELNRFDEALASYAAVLALQPDHADALYNRGNALKAMRRLGEALASFEAALAADADHPLAWAGAVDCAAQICDWDRRERYAAELARRVTAGTAVVLPLVLLGYSGDRALQFACARAYAPPPSLPLWTGETWRHDRLRIAYLSADLRHHATAYLMAELFERHDRERFEIVAISFGGEDDSDMRRRLVAAFDQFHEVSADDDAAIARRLRDLEVDIAVDLKGYTGHARPGILAHRPAPIQVNYLGYPGTLGADYIDYVVADRTTVPFADAPFYSEKIVHLPDCYQVNDSRRPIAQATPTRQQAGLLADGFVFCCFNNSWKITPAHFDVWMRLLKAVPGSVLWLLKDNPEAEANLRAAAEARGVDPARLVFAGRMPLENHLARHRLADLFLDTLPYNAHTTASDALWTGLPVVTCPGEAFAGRVAASLLDAAGLPELVTASLADYEALALSLAGDPGLLAGVRARLAENRNTCALFDTARFARHLEVAYTMMWERWQRGEAPESFAVPPIDRPETPAAI